MQAPCRRSRPRTRMPGIGTGKRGWVGRMTGRCRNLARRVFCFRGGKPGPEKPAPPSRVSFKLLPAADAVNVVGLSKTQVATLYGVKTHLLRRYFPLDQLAWVGVPPELLPKTEPALAQAGQSLHYRHIILPPFLRHTAVDAIRLN